MSDGSLENSATHVSLDFTDLVIVALLRFEEDGDVLVHLTKTNPSAGTADRVTDAALPSSNVSEYVGPPLTVPAPSGDTDADTTYVLAFRNNAV